MQLRWFCKVQLWWVALTITFFVEFVGKIIMIFITVSIMAMISNSVMDTTRYEIYS